MKKVVFLFLLVISLPVICQEYTYIPYNIHGTDSMYFKKPFATNDPVQVFVDFTGVSTNTIAISFYYVVKLESGSLRLTPIENLPNPVTLDKTVYSVVANGVTTNVFSFKLTKGFKGDQIAYKIVKSDAIVTDVIKILPRK
jgi:hypothetical protein